MPPVKPKLLLLLAILLTGILLFFRLNELPIQLWDESRQAVSAFEMYKSKNFLVNTYDMRPDMWSTKPPFLIWMQVLFMNIVGVNEWAIRLPGAIGGLITCLFIFWFCRKKFDSVWAGFLSCMVLVTSYGFICLHGTRTGDFDAILTLFTTLYTLLFFLYMEDDKPKYFYGSVLFIILAVLTKGIAGTLFIPALFFYSLYKKKTLPFLKKPSTYIGIFLFLFICVGFYLLRDHYNPGYINAVKQNELGGRYMQVNEEHSQGTFYYLYLNIVLHFHYWIAFLPVGFILLLRKKQHKNIGVFLLMTSLLFLLVLSSASTKIAWYNMPVLPLFAIVVGYCINTIMEAVCANDNFKNLIGARYISLVPFILAGMLFFNPYRESLKRVFNVTQMAGTTAVQDGIPSLLQGMDRNTIHYSGLKLCYNNYQADIEWYRKILKEKGITISHEPVAFLKAGDTVAVSEPSLKHDIEKDFSASIIDKHREVTIYAITGRSAPPLGDQ